MKRNEILQLILLAKEAREKAYAPYSNYKVGACVVATAGKTFTGCNIENASFGGTICAERVAISKAVSEGYLNIKIVVVVTESRNEKKGGPCGFCRQFIYEFAPKAQIIVSDLENNYQLFSLEHLLPHAFGPKNL